LRRHQRCALDINYEHGNTDNGNTDYGNTDYGNTDYGNTDYTQRSILSNTETASTHQFVSYLNAFSRCDPSMTGRPWCRFQGESPEIIAFPGSEPF
jgi:hypothetical protein